VTPWPLGLTGWIYGAASAVLGLVFIAFAMAVAANKATEPKDMGPEKRLFAFSILYLFVLFAALVADRWLLA
jgi:protoheme IX farnesyltransferase